MAMGGAEGVRAALVVGLRRRRANLRLAQLTTVVLFADGVAALISVFSVVTLWVRITPIDRGPLEPWLLVLFPVLWVCLIALFGGDDVSATRFGRRSLAAVAQTWAVLCLALLLSFFVEPWSLRRLATLEILTLSAIATLVFRFAYLRIAPGGIVERRVLLIGTDESARRVAQVMTLLRGTVSYRPVAFVGADAESGGQIGGLPVMRRPIDITELTQDLGIDLIAVGHTRNLAPEFLVELLRCVESGAEALSATTLYEQLAGRVMASSLEADWYAQLPTRGRGVYAVIKPVFDFVAAAGLSIVLFPLMFAAAAAILVETGRPIHIRQVRVGARGAHFILHKFRTMRIGAEDDGPRWAVVNDPRCTKVGRFLRRHRIDELPQLWDVLAGKMSLIGPRPERPEFVAQLSRALPLYSARTVVRPGMTGWAQVELPYAATVGENLAKLECDLFYVRHLGPLLDLSIALRTIGIVLGVSRPEFADQPELVAHE